MRNQVSTRVFCLSVIVALAMAIAGQNSANAQCTPGWVIFGGCGGQWHIVQPVAAPRIVEQAWGGSLSTGATKGCSYHGETSPTATCAVVAGQATVIQWNLSGELTASICNAVGITVGANVGQSSQHNYGSNSGITISSFCQRCIAFILLRYRETDYELRCSCLPSFMYGNRISGMVIQFIGTRVHAVPGDLLLWCNCCLAPNPYCKPCNPHCPDPPVD